MAATKAGPRSGIPTSSRFGYAGGSSLKAHSPATTATSVLNGGLCATQSPKSQLSFNPSRKPVSGLSSRTENCNSSEGLQHVGKHNGHTESLPIKADVYIKPPNSTPNSRLNSPVNATFSGLQPPGKDKLINNGSKLQYSSQLHDIAKRREQSQSPKTVVSDQEPVNDASGHLTSLALADKKRHSSDSTANKYKLKQNIPSPLRESNKIDVTQHNSSLKPRRGSSPHSTLVKQDKTLNHVADTPSSAFQAYGKFDNRQMLREPAEKNKRLSSSSSGSDDAVVPSVGTAFHKIPVKAESLKALGSQQKFTGIPQAFSPPPKASSDEADGLNSKSRLKPQHHVLPMSSGLQAKSDNTSAYGTQPQRSLLLPKSNANQNNMLAVARATSPPHVKPNMLPRVIKMKNSNQVRQQEELKKDSSHLSDHNTKSSTSLSLNNSESVEKPTQPMRSLFPVSTSQIVSNNTTTHPSASNLQPPVALVKNNLLDEINDTDSCISETGSESTAATVVMGKQSSIADLTSLDSSSPSVTESSNAGEDDFLQLSPPLNPDEFPPYFSHDTKFLGKLQNIGFDTGSNENSPTLKSAPQDVATQEDHSETECAYSEEDVVTALDAIEVHSDETKVPSSNVNSNHPATPQMKSNMEPRSRFLLKLKDMEAHRDQSVKTMSLPSLVRRDGLSRFGMKRDKPGKLSEQVSPECSTDSSGQNVSQRKKELHSLSERRERNKTIAFSREFLKSNEDKSMIKPIASGLKLHSTVRSEQNLTMMGKTDLTQLHSNLKLRTFSPPHSSSMLLASNGGGLKDGKTNLEVVRKKTLLKKPTEGFSDVTSDKEPPSLIKPTRSDVDGASPSLKLKSPPHLAFKTPVTASANQSNGGQQLTKCPVQQFMVPSPLSPMSPVIISEEDKITPIANKQGNTSDPKHERSISSPQLTQGSRYQDTLNSNPRKFSYDGEKSTSNTIESYGRTKSPSPVQRKNENNTLGTSNVDSDANVASTQTSPLKNTELNGSDNSHTVQEASITDSIRSMDTVISPMSNTDLTEKPDDAAGSSKVAVEETSTESIGMLQSAMLTNHDLPQVQDDVQRVEVVNDQHKPINEPSNHHILPQIDQSSSVASSVVTGVPDKSIPNNVVIDKVATSVDSMGSHVDSTAVNTCSSVNRSHHVEKVLDTEQEAASVTSPQLNVVGPVVAGDTKREDEDSDDGDGDFISNTSKQFPSDFETQEQSDLLADDRSDVLSCISHVSDRSHTSNFSFRMKPYMPAHVIAEESYLEQRKRESLTGNDRVDFLENNHFEVPPQLQRRVPLSKRPNSELERSLHWFQSDPNLDLRRSASRSPTYFDRYTPEHQFRDSEVCVCIHIFVLPCLVDIHIMLRSHITKKPLVY